MVNFFSCIEGPKTEHIRQNIIMLIMGIAKKNSHPMVVCGVLFESVGKSIRLLMIVYAIPANKINIPSKDFAGASKYRNKSRYCNFLVVKNALSESMP